MQPKDYDSTLARMAGNIVGPLLIEGRLTDEQAALVAVDIAATIIKKCREKFIADAELRAEKGTP